jgi:hypothetical protein
MLRFSFSTHTSIAKSGGLNTFFLKREILTALKTTFNTKAAERPKHRQFVPQNYIAQILN